MPADEIAVDDVSVPRPLSPEESVLARASIIQSEMEDDVEIGGGPNESTPFDIGSDGLVDTDLYVDEIDTDFYVGEIDTDFHVDEIVDDATNRTSATQIMKGDKGSADDSNTTHPPRTSDSFDEH
eukprot:CAMPEP_0172545412 /NCGR_PEP_ID=MMETSP1067-20121228/15333_1 /TAXON_ID=265564 ORGANISM="Thalassiosira punctigera, Strain Tpunct2005C2" /NCGR_SAMPLE_ID=MMETSP1067 /ASSEMBLY_ACC=CAM_ASM_000444 /LENGTH=124 /DNA_ID=CAMNT_0013332141 /DNA_START=69 /DNA_END=443 /DNA_ORIENTATION=+